MKKVAAANEGDESLRRRQAIGINRVLSHLGAVVNNLNAGYNNSTGFRNSALTMLLRNCLGGAARALLIANIGPEAEWCSETFMTLTFAQKMMLVRNVEKATFIDKSQSSIFQMRQRHIECIQRLQEGAAAEKDGEEHKELQRLQLEVRELGNKLLTKNSAKATLERMQEEQNRKMDELREQMMQVMASEFANVQEQSLQGIDDLRRVIETKTREGHEIVARQLREANEAQTTRLQDELVASMDKCKAALANVAQLRVQLAAVDQRAQSLQDVQQDLLCERAAREEERRSMREQAEEQFRRLVDLEGEVQKFRLEAGSLQGQVEELRAACTVDAGANHAEREAWTAREADLKAEVLSLRQRVEAERAREQEATKCAEAARGRLLEGLHVQRATLEREASTQQRQLEDERREQELLEADVMELREREVAAQQQLEDAGEMYDEEVERARRRVEELTEMLDEVQGFIHLRSRPRKR